MIFDIEEPFVFTGNSYPFSNLLSVLVGNIRLQVDDRNTHQHNIIYDNIIHNSEYKNMFSI